MTPFHDLGRKRSHEQCMLTQMEQHTMVEQSTAINITPTIEQEEERRREQARHTRRERDRARRQSLIPSQRQQVNARRRAQRQTLTTEQRQLINARRRTDRQSLSQDERQSMLNARNTRYADRQAIPCAQSIAMPCPESLSSSVVNPSIAQPDGTEQPQSRPFTSAQGNVLG